MSEFLRMGGYAFYVWGAWGITVLVLVANLVSAIRQHRRQRELLRHELDDVESD